MGYAVIVQYGDMDMKILIRSEGGHRIGMGHVMRMLVLANAIREFADVEFACREDEEFQPGIKHIESCGYTVHKIDGENVVGELARIGGSCLITDSYEVDEEYFDRTGDIFPVTGYMDDLNRHRINVDFIINQNVYAGDLRYRTDKRTELFLGTKYVLLRDEFQKLPKRNTKKEIRNVLITLGGSDPKNLTGEIALKLSRAFPGVIFHVVVGLSFSNIDDVKKIAGGNIYIHINPKMSELMLKCDAAISACGSTVYELCACGTPVIGVVTADNQEMAAENLDSIGVLKLAGETDEIIGHLNGMNYEVRFRMSKIAQSLVDGCGSFRLANGIKEIMRFKIIDV